MKKIARISTAAFLAGVTTLAVTLPMPVSASAGVSSNTPRLAAEAAKSEQRD